MKRWVAVLLLLLFLSGMALAQTSSGGGGGSATYPQYTVATLPSVHPTYQIVWVTDGNSASDCTTGLGSSKVLCYWNGAAWTAISSSGGTPALNDVTNPSADKAFTMSSNRLNYNFTADCTTTYCFSVTSAGGAAFTPPLFLLSTGAANTQKVFAAYAQGTSNGVEIDSTGAFTAVGTGSITATNATNIGTAASTTNSAFSIPVVASTSGNQAAKTVAGFTINPSTSAMLIPGALTAVGAINGSTVSSGTAPTALGSATGGIAFTAADVVGSNVAGQFYQRAALTGTKFLFNFGSGEVPLNGPSGGTGSSFFTVAGPTAARTYTFPDAAATIASGTGTTGTLPKYTTGATGIVGNSLLDDGVTTANALTYTGTAGVRSPAFTSTGTTAGFIDFPQGTTSASVAPCNTATSICFQAPTSVTSQLRTFAGTPATGFPRWTNTGGSMVETIAAIANTDLPAQLTAETKTGIYNFNQAAQSQSVVSGTEYYVTNSDLDMPAAYTTAIAAGTSMEWRVAMTKTAAGTGTFQLFLKKGTNGSTADTSIATVTIGTQTAAADNMELDISLTWTSATAAYWTVIPHQAAATGTGFGLVYPAAAAQFSGTISAQTTTTASDKYGLSFKATTGTPTIVVNMVKAHAFGVN